MANGDGERIILRAEVDAEVERLRAVCAAQRDIVVAVAEMSVEGDVFDQPFYALVSEEHLRDEAWHQQLVSKARALLVAMGQPSPEARDFLRRAESNPAFRQMLERLRDEDEKENENENEIEKEIEREGVE